MLKNFLTLAAGVLKLGDLVYSQYRSFRYNLGLQLSNEITRLDVYVASVEARVSK